MAALHAQLNKLGMMEQKADIICEFTNGRTRSARELFDNELENLVGQLANAPVKLPGDRMRKSIISMAHELGWRKAGRIDMQAVNNWCVTRGKFHKPLNDHSLSELVELVTQFKIMYEKELNK